MSFDHSNVTSVVLAKGLSSANVRNTCSRLGRTSCSRSNDPCKAVTWTVLVGALKVHHCAPRSSDFGLHFEQEEGHLLPTCSLGILVGLGVVWGRRPPASQQRAEQEGGP